ncbi:MAG: HAMP domain-containing sensor histidine kinase [bacterium]
MIFTRQFKILISAIIIMIIFIIVSINILIIFQSRQMDTFYRTEASRLAGMIDDIEDGSIEPPSFILSIHLFEEGKYNNRKVVYGKGDRDNLEGSKLIENIPGTDLRMLIVFRDINPYFNIIIIFNTVIMLMVLIVFLGYFIYIYMSRKRYIENILSIRSADDIDIVRSQVNPDGDLVILIDFIENYTGKYKEEIKKLNNEIASIEHQNKSLLNRDILKTGIIENISHELKSPLTKVKGYIEYIYEGEMGPINEKQTEAIKIASSNLELVLKQIDRILLYTKDEMYSDEMEQFPLKGVISDVYDAYREEFARKDIETTVDTENLVSDVRGTRMALFEVFDNIINNALKFTPKGGKIIIQAYERQFQSRINAVVRISDTGVGVPTDKIDKIFERFYQVEQNTNRKYSGMGLGLTISKNIIERHGGAIDVNSSADEGTTFIIRLPVINAEG